MPFGAFGRVPEDQPCCEPTCEQPCPLGTGTHCGSVYAMQTMLGVLGFLHPLDETSIDGRNGPKTRGAVAAYALAKGIPVDPNKPSGLFCVALIADYNAYVDPGPGATDPNECAPGQWGAPPFCFGQPSSVPPPPKEAGACPPPTVGLPPYCVTLPGGGAPPVPPGASACPPGTLGLPPHCFGVPGGVPPTTPPGTPPKPPPGPKPPGPKPPGPKPPGPKPPGPKPPAGPPPPTPGPVPAKGFWESRSDGEKALLLGGGAAVGLLLVAALMSGRRRKPSSKKLPALTSNPRGRRKTKRRRAKLRKASKRRTKRRTKRVRRKKKWAQAVDRSMQERGTVGSFTKQARNAGYSDTMEFARKVMAGWRDGSKTVYNKRTRRNMRITKRTMYRANFAINIQKRRR